MRSCSSAAASPRRASLRPSTRSSGQRAYPYPDRAQAGLGIRGMLLAIDVGNTQTVFGLFDGDRLAEHWRVATEAHRTGDELGALVTDFLDLERVGGICLSS